MAVRSGFKHTEIGDLPTDWAVAPFGDLALIERGKFSARPRNDPRFYGGDIPFLQTGDVTRSGGVVENYSQTLNSDGLRVSRLFPKGTLLFTIAANIGDVGITAFDAACPDSLVAVSPRSSVDKRWLFYELASRKSDFENLASPGAQLNINLEKLLPYLLPVPSREEQRRVGEVLGDLDALLAGLDRLIAKKRDLKQAAMQQLLTGQTRLPGFGGEWEMKRFGEIAPLQRGFDLPNPTLRPGPYPVVYSNGVLTYHNKYQSHGPGVVTGRSGTIGKVTYIDSGPYWPHNTALWVTSFRGNDPKFVFYLCTRIRFERFASGSGVPTLNRNDVHSFEVEIPPTKAEQTAIATVLSDMDAELAALEARRDKTRALKRGMMQELLTGRTRLV